MLRYMKFYLLHEEGAVEPEACGVGPGSLHVSEEHGNDSGLHVFP